MNERLENARETLEQTSRELEEEGIGNLTYWLMRSGIDRDEYQEWAQKEINLCIREQSFQELNTGAQIVALFSLGFVYGLIVGRDTDDEF